MFKCSLKNIINHYITYYLQIEYRKFRSGQK